MASGKLCLAPLAKLSGTLSDFDIIDLLASGAVMGSRLSDQSHWRNTARCLEGLLLPNIPTSQHRLK